MHSPSCSSPLRSHSTTSFSCEPSSPPVKGRRGQTTATLQSPLSSSSFESHSKMRPSFPLLDSTAKIPSSAVIHLSSKQCDLIKRLVHFILNYNELDRNLGSQFLAKENLSFFNLVKEYLKSLGTTGEELLKEVEKIPSKKYAQLLLKLQLSLGNVLQSSDHPQTSSSTTAGPSSPLLSETREKLEVLKELILDFRLSLEVIPKWISIIKSSFSLPHSAPSCSSSSLVFSSSEALDQSTYFFGSWQQISAPEGIKSQFWPPYLSRCCFWEELCRSFLGSEDGTLFNRASMKLEGPLPVEITDCFPKGEDGIIRLTDQKSFFAGLISILNRWIAPSEKNSVKDNQLLVEKLVNLTALPTRPFEQAKVERFFPEIIMEELSKIQPEEEPDFEKSKAKVIQGLVRFMRTNALIKNFPVIALLGASTINAAVGSLTTRNQYLFHLFADRFNEKQKHLYCSIQDKDFGTHLIFKTPEELNLIYRVTQVTQYLIHAHPHRVEGGTYGPPLGTFKFHWTVGLPTMRTDIRKLDSDSPRAFYLRITNLTFTEDASPDDRILIPFLFREAHSRYSRDLETLFTWPPPHHE